MILNKSFIQKISDPKISHLRTDNDSIIKSTLRINILMDDGHIEVVDFVKFFNMTILPPIDINDSLIRSYDEFFENCLVGDW